MRSEKMALVYSRELLNVILLVYTFILKLPVMQCTLEGRLSYGHPSLVHNWYDMLYTVYTRTPKPRVCVTALPRGNNECFMHCLCAATQLQYIRRNEYAVKNALCLVLQLSAACYCLFLQCNPRLFSLARLILAFQFYCLSGVLFPVYMQVSTLYINALYVLLHYNGRY